MVDAVMLWTMVLCWAMVLWAIMLWTRTIHVDFVDPFFFLPSPPVFNVAPLLACPDGRWKRCSAVLENRARKSNGFGCGKQRWRHGTQTPEEEWWWCGKRIRQTLA